MKRKVEVVEYNPQWSSIFLEEAKLIKQALHDNFVDLHHIGSTSVPGLASKPIIDILAVVQDITLVDAQSPTLETLGYIAMGEHGMPMRRFFQKGLDIKTHNLHIFEHGNTEIERHINLRNWLRMHPEDLAAYAALKKELASRFPDDIFSYCIGKEQFIANLDKKAGWNGIRFVKALTPREWEAVKRLRNSYFFEVVGREDPNTETLYNSEHAHLVLYSGIDIIGYSHIQFCVNKQAAIRFIIIDENVREPNVGSAFLHLCEQWLKSLGIKSVDTDSS